MKNILEFSVFNRRSRVNVSECGLNNIAEHYENTLKDKCRNAFNYLTGAQADGQPLRYRAFTLSEVMITMIVLGVVLSLTLPMMHNGASDKKWNVGRQKANATIGEAFKMATVNGEIDKSKTTAEFVNNVLGKKYLKLERTCARNDFAECGFPSSIKRPDGVKVTIAPNTWTWSALSNANVYRGALPASGGTWNDGAASGSKTWPSAKDWPSIGGSYNSTGHNENYFFRTLDGFSVSFFYNPECASAWGSEYARWWADISGTRYYVQQSVDTVCMMGVYDMNGKAGPNQVGKDIGFIGSFYNGFTTKSAAVLPHAKEVMHNQTGLSGNSWDKLSQYCEKIDKNKTWIMPDVDETSLLYLNQMLVRGTKSVERWFFSRSPLGATGYFRRVDFGADTGGGSHWGARSTTNTYGPYVRCVRRTEMK